MMKTIGLLLASAAVGVTLCTSAFAWDNCGRGYHRNYSGYCVSNYGRTSGCPYGYHLGWNTPACVPNR
jgi:hypothetical protein